MKIEVSIEEAVMVEAFKAMRKMAKSNATVDIKEQAISIVFSQACEMLDRMEK